MRSILLTTALLVVSAAVVAAQSSPARPKITGISHLAVYTSNPAATEHYYVKVIGAVKMPDPENPQGARYVLNGSQFVEVLPLPPNSGINRMDHAGLNTEDADGMRKYLAAKGWTVPAKVTKGPEGSRWFEVKDPEGNTIQFVQPPADAKVEAPNAIGRHIIHVGFLVHDRAKQDSFYREILGFRPYWYGGMQEGKVDWVSQQVPDGRDWIEYMMSGGPGTGIPANMSQHTLGVLDHVAIGEKSVDEAYNTLKSEGRLEGVQCDKGTKIGRDGKAQFNMYDPDEIRSELMNFHATEKPCCSEFTAEDPVAE
jgi:catechol 2,3-dioxygenase-like lactoylglutathione lyase family enzyme